MAWARLGEGQQTPSLRCEALRPDGPGAVSGGKDLTEERTVAEVREGRGGERKGEEEEGEGGGGGVGWADGGEAEGEGEGGSKLEDGRDGAGHCGCLRMSSSLATSEGGTRPRELRAWKALKRRALWTLGRADEE